MQLQLITTGFEAGRLQGIHPYEPKLGITDTQIEAQVQARLAGLLAARGIVEPTTAEQPSDEALAELLGHPLDELTEEPLEAGPYPVLAVQVLEPPVEILERGEKRQCPMDGKWFHRFGFKNHFMMSMDPLHLQMARRIWPPGLA